MGFNNSLINSPGKIMKFNKKHGFLIRDVVLTGILFTGVMALFIIIIAAMSSNYNKPELLSDSFNKNFNKLSDLSSDVDNSRIAVTNSNSSGLQLMGNFDIAFGATWNVINLVFSTIDLYASMGSSIVSEFTFIDSNIIKILMYILMASLLTYIIFSVISSVMRGRL